MKKTWIKNLKPGLEIESVFVIRKLEAKEYNGRKFLSLELGDKTGRIGAVCWELAETYLQTIETGSVVNIRGLVGTYRDALQVNISEMSRVKDSDIEPSDFMPSGIIEPSELLKELDALIESVKDRDYRALLDKIFGDALFRRKFSIAPAAKLWHHSYIGGLAEHTLNNAKICDFLCTLYTDLDRDLIVTGALLHDIGKVDSYSLNNFFEYTDEGRLSGHIVIADRIISDRLKTLRDFPSEKAKLIRHLVLSHQGTYEQASPVLPQTLEANVLYVVDLLDSRVGGIKKVFGKTDFQNRRWTNYVNLLDRFLYIGNKQDDE